MQLLQQTRALYLVIEIARGALSNEQIAAIVKYVIESLAKTAVIKPRRKCRCQRAVRQPSKSWPKMRLPTSEKLDVKIEIVRSDT